MSRSNLCAALHAVAIFAGLALAGAPGGCASVSNGRAAQDLAKAPAGERTPTARELGLPTAGAITLGEIERATLRANPLIIQSFRQYEAAEARVGEAEGAYWPQVGANPAAQYRYETQNSASVPPQTNHATNFQAFGFSVSWLIFDFGRTPALVRQAAKSALSAEESWRAAQVNVLFTARSAFFNLEKQRKLLEVANENVRDFEARLDQVRAFVQVGRAGFTPYDETKAEVDLGNARLTEITTHDAVRLAQSSLANAIGLNEITEWATVTPTALPPVTLTFEQAWQVARANQPALSAARAQEEAASAVVDAQIAALFPSITAAAGYSASGLTFPLSWNWQVGPNLNWTIFNGFTNYYTIDEAAANLRSARAQRVFIEQQTWVDVRQTYIALEDARARVDLTALTIQQAMQNLVLVQGRYEVGRASAVDLTDAQVALVQARGDAVQARADYETALANLWKALGRTSWD